MEVASNRHSDKTPIPMEHKTGEIRIGTHQKLRLPSPHDVGPVASRLSDAGQDMRMSLHAPTRTAASCSALAFKAQMN
jgi:hypothetical protein